MVTLFKTIFGVYICLALLSCPAPSTRPPSNQTGAEPCQLFNGDGNCYCSGLVACDSNNQYCGANANSPGCQCVEVSLTSPINCGDPTQATCGVKCSDSLDCMNGACVCGPDSNRGLNGTCVSGYAPDAQGNCCISTCKDKTAVGGFFGNCACDFCAASADPYHPQLALLSASGTPDSPYANCMQECGYITDVVNAHPGLGAPVMVINGGNCIEGVCSRPCSDVSCICLLSANFGDAYGFELQNGQYVLGGFSSDACVDRCEAWGKAVGEYGAGANC